MAHPVYEVNIVCAESNDLDIIYYVVENLKALHYT